MTEILKDFNNGKNEVNKPLVNTPEEWKEKFKRWDEEERNKPLYDKNDKEIMNGDTVAVGFAGSLMKGPPDIYYNIYKKDGLMVGKLNDGKEIKLWIYSKLQRTILNR